VCTALLSLPAAAATRTAVPAQQQGVTKDAIEMVILYPDIDALKAKGIESRSSNEGFAKKFTTYVDAYGPINGRDVVVKQIAWDPIDPTSYDKACTASTQDTKPFVVVNGTGYNTSAVACISVDNKTPFMYGDMAAKSILKASGKNLVTLRESPDITAATAADIVNKGKLIPKSAKIGILANNEPTLKASGDALEAALEKRGYDVVSKVEINGLSSNLGVISREATAAATTFQAAGVDTVFHTQSFQAVGPFFREVERGGLGFKQFAIDTQANMCTPGGSAASDLPASAAGTVCITPWDFKSTVDKSGLQPDTKFEAKCREQYDTATGRTGTPGAYSGGVVENGVTYEEDFPAPECNLTNVLLPAIKKAGKDLTWDKVYANIMGTTNAPMAYGSDGKGGYGKNKPYLPSKAHVVELVAASPDTPADANGLFNGCPIPANCWVPVEVNGQEWFPIKAS
jgi:hypothetical protein